MENKYFVNALDGVHGNDVITPVGRAAFLYLTKRNDKFPNPRTGKGKYGITLLFKKDDEIIKTQLKAVQDMCVDMANFFAQNQWKKTDKKIPFAKFKESVIAAFAGQPFLRDGDTTKYEGFSGHWYIVAKNDEISGAGGIVLQDNRHPEEFEAGMLVRAQVQPYLDKKGFSYKLRRLKLIKDDGFRFAAAAGPDLLSSLDEGIEAISAYSKDEGKESSLSEEYDKALEATSNPAQAPGLNIL